jgi:hypothetical protein
MFSQSFLDRYWSKVDRKGADQCWNWTASTAGKGYGQIKDEGKRRQLYSHRVAFIIAYGEPPKRNEAGEVMEVCHKCDNPRCCNPAHLFLGTRAKNAQDMSIKLRSTWGIRSGTCKLTEDDIRLIRKLYSEMKVSQQRIAGMFSISQIQVSRIVTGKQWTHLE